MQESIYQLSWENLQAEHLAQEIYPNYEQRYYWSNNWSPRFYIEQARAGMIATAYLHQDIELLLPEIQTHYAILDWQNLRVHRLVRRWMLAKTWLDGDFELLINTDVDSVIERICQTHTDNWLLPSYRRLMHNLSQSNTGSYFRMLACAIREKSTGILLAGEFGYSSGTVYTSLSGFYDRSNPAYSGLGFVQLYVLARILRTQGFSFWNLGHPHMRYKRDLGAQILDRMDFLGRFLPAQTLPTISPYLENPISSDKLLLDD